MVNATEYRHYRNLDHEVIRKTLNQELVDAGQLLPAGCFESRIPDSGHARSSNLRMAVFVHPVSGDTVCNVIK